MGALVVAEVSELGVTEDAAGGPFGEFDFGNGFGFEPDVIFHVLGGDVFAQIARPTAGEICNGQRSVARGLRVRSLRRVPRFS